jgi:hypothetical protein
MGVFFLFPRFPPSVSASHLRQVRFSPFDGGFSWLLFPGHQREKSLMLVDLSTMIDKNMKPSTMNSESSFHKEDRMERLGKAELEVALRHFSGTEQYYKTGFRTRCTDGVYFLAENAQCYWLLDIIDSVAPFNDFAVVVLTVTEGEGWRSGKVIIDNGHDKRSRDHKLFHTQDIEYTDFPLESVKLYVQDGVILLPSEY